MKLKNILVEVVDKNSDFMKIMDILKGRIDPKDVDFNEDWISKVDKDYIYFDFHDVDEFYDIMTPFDDDERNDIEWLRGDPSRYYEFDSYMIDEDWSEGYVYNSMSEENEKLFKKLVTLLKPEWKTLNFSNDWDKVRDFIDATLPDLKEKILDYYWQGRDGAFERGNERMAEEYTENILKTLGIEFNRSWYYGTNDFKSVKMPLSNLMIMYATVGTPNDSIEKILDTYSNKKVMNFLGSPRDSVYEYEDTEWFGEYFNENITSLLEETFEEMEEEFIPDYDKIYDYVQKKYGFNKVMAIPSSLNKEHRIYLKTLTPEGKIDFTIYGEDGRKKEGVAKVSTIETLFNNYQLFDIFD